MYNKVTTDLNFVQREKEVEAFWKENDIFRKSMENRKEGETYTFYDGPPTANGKPHIGHVLTRVIKDMIPRYRTMKGYMVPRKAGWDTHGLPVELEVEKLLGLDGKEQIEEYGLDPFIDKCKESVWKYKGMWEDFSGTVGFWADMDDPYVTYDDNFIESEWWALKQIWDKGLLYKGFKIVPYCPRCGTPLSSHEVAQGYKAVKERSAIARFKVVGEDAYFLAWTTTPWTLPSNVALCVNPEDTYVKVKAADGYTYYMAEALCNTVLGKLAVKADKEGLMVNLDVPYQRKRHKGILKVKRFYTMDLEITGFEEGSGRLEGTLGSLVVDFKGNEVRVGSGFSDEQREEFWRNREELLGALCEVKYKEISKDKTSGAESLQFPVFVTLRRDKTTVNYE